MPSSINGWPVLDNPPWDDPRLTRLKVPGTPCVVYGRASVAPLFVALALDYHHTIHPLVSRSDVDTYDYRQARAAAAWSDHSSGTATDLRAANEGAQGSGNYAWWKGAKAAAARTIKARYEIVIWGGAADLGGDYGNPVYWDWMHWALKPGTTQADVNRVIAKLGIRPDGTRADGPPPTPGTVKPTLPTKGPEWLLRFLRAHNAGVLERAWFAVLMRESAGDPSVVYPKAPVNWAPANPDAPPFWDTGLAQINSRHWPSVKKLFPQASDMRVMLDAESNWRYAQTLNWLDWGLRIAPDGKSYSFDWRGYPAAWVQQNAAAAEAGFREWWDKYPAVAAQVFPGPTPTPTPVKPTISLAAVQPGKSGAQVLVVQKALARAVGLDYSSGPGVFGPRTQAAYRGWQLALGYTGADADGKPGRASLTALGDRYGFNVVA